MAYIKGGHIKAEFDVQVDGNNRWDEDRICEIDVYPVSLNLDGFHETDTTEPLASVRVPTGDYSDDAWFMLPGAWDQLRAMPKPLPENIIKGIEEAMAEALAAHLKIERTQRFDRGATVFITEHIMPGTVEAHTVNGGYIVNMADSGELDEFSEEELEAYDRERWES
jgi:hypothetical protein